MRKKMIHRLLTALAALAFVGCLGVVCFQFYQYHVGDRIYSEAQAMAGMPQNNPPVLPGTSSALAVLPEKSDFSDASAVGTQAGDTEQSQQAPEPESEPEPEPTPEPAPAPEDPYVTALNNMDFAVLRQTNQDVVGWIMIPDTQLSYPLMQGKDNQFYLEHAWNRKWAAVGSIFLECKSNRDLSDFNTIVYGHRMRNGSMFGSIRNYKNSSYWKEHPSVYITDGNGTHIYDIYAAYEADLSDPTFWVGVTQQENKEKFIEHTLTHSVLDTGIIPVTQDQILTLSTCTGNGYATRWVVHAVKRPVSS